MSRSDGKTGVGLLSLKWNNYKSIFFETIKTLREKSKYTDATLAVDGHFYHVHKLVMSTCSEYFSDIFEKTPCKAPVIVLKDVSRDEIEGLLSYMYLGEVNVHQNNLASFLKTAESLRIKGLAVSDDQPTNLSKSQTSSRKDASRDSPSLKRQRLENTGSSPAVPPVKSLKKSDTPLAMKVEMNSPEMSKTKQNKPPMVKIGMSDAEEREQRIRTKINYEEDPGSEQETGDVYGPDSPMTDHSPEQEESEHEAENVASTSFFGSAQQQSAENKGEVEWEEEDASSFIPETYMGNVSTSLQTQGPANTHCTVSIPKMSVLSGEDVRKLEKLEKKLKEMLDGMNALGRQAAAFYYMEDDMRSYGNPAMVLVGLNVAAVQSHPRFHVDRHPLQRVMLPTSPNLLVMSFSQARDFLKVWLPKFLGHFPGYGKPENKPIWWPIEWSKSPQVSGTNRMQLLMIIAALYQHYEKIEVELPPDVPQTQAAAVASTKAEPQTQSAAVVSTQAETSSGEDGQCIQF